MSNPKLLPIQSDRSLQLPLPTLVTLFDPELPILFFFLSCFVCVCVCKHQLFAAGKKSVGCHSSVCLPTVAIVNTEY